MSAILGVFGGVPSEPAITRMVHGLRGRGADRSEIRRDSQGMLAVSRFEWERAPQFSGSALVVDDGASALVADASIYYREDLRRRLASRGVSVPSEADASTLVIAAYRVWGSRAARELEGDFAFVLWDRRQRRAYCARDFGGKRPLYYAVFDDTLVIASTVSAVIAHPRASGELNLANVCDTLSQQWGGSADTCYAGVSELPAGASLTWIPGEDVRIAVDWEPPPIGHTPPTCFEEGVAELRQRLGRAVAERLAPDADTSVWMSGGWDSPSVFASGQAQLRREGERRRRLHPVSISYPEGDPGREDELITAIAEHWNSHVHWLDIERIPLFDEPARRAGERDVPFAHTYEHWNRALARGSRGTGTRVALDGNGGDQLFQVSDIFLADLFRDGRWTSVAREWRQKGGQGWRTFARWVVLPAMPTGFQHAVAAVRGREERDYLDRALPFWVREDFAKRHGLRERERSAMPSRRGYRGWRREAHFFLAAPTFPRAFQCLSGLALEEGVELRSPLYDRRIVEFACSRPRAERNSGKETKRLLRAAMSGLLPAHVLAPRERRTGITTAYSDRRIREAFPALLAEVLENPVLANLGIIEPSRVRVAWEQYLRTGDLSLKIPLFLTIQVELWLRARLHSSAAHAPVSTAFALGQLVT